MMKHLFAAFAALGLVAVPAAALAKNPSIEAPIRQFAEGFNKGDLAMAAATVAPSVTIVDEIAPFRWEGKDAFMNWAAAYDSDAKAKGIADPVVTIGDPTRELVAEGHAYVIVPAVYTFTQKGVKMREVAQMTFALEQGPAGWKISGWTWTGPDASPTK